MFLQGFVNCFTKNEALCFSWSIKAAPGGSFTIQHIPTTSLGIVMIQRNISCGLGCRCLGLHLTPLQPLFVSIKTKQNHWSQSKSVIILLINYKLTAVARSCDCLSACNFSDFLLSFDSVLPHRRGLQPFKTISPIKKTSGQNKLSPCLQHLYNHCILFASMNCLCYSQPLPLHCHLGKHDIKAVDTNSS